MSTTPPSLASLPVGPPAQRTKQVMPNPTTAQYLWPPLQFGAWTGKLIKHGRGAPFANKIL